MDFANLEQRIAQTYIDMFPDFVPDEHSTEDRAGLERFYTLMKIFYQIVFDEPLFFVASLQEDDAYPNSFHKSS